MSLLTLPADVTDAVQAICPINGISFGSLTDKTSWLVDFNNATPDQQAAAATAISNYSLPA